MAYDSEFYRMYRAYLEEPTVRANHDEIFGYFRMFTRRTLLFVADLGCGLGEYSLRGNYADYAGVDITNTGQAKNFIQADYRELDFVNRLPFRPNAFVSLFSIECCHSAADKYALYERIFSAIPSLECGLVGGFFYEGRKTLEKVAEKGNVVSYQTIEDPSLYISRIFSEFRIHMRTPSRMFGEDVVEVWKIFLRRR